MAETEVQFLRQKVREQAARLQELEKFRRMSEQPLPGSYPAPNPVPSQSQLPEIYASLYSRMHEVLSDNAALEESLRTEVLESEHQRAYIEVLKQALEVKMSDLGLKGSAEDFSQFALMKTDAEGTKREFTRLQNLLKQKEMRVAQLQSSLSDLQATAGSHDKLQNELRSSQAALQEAETRAKQLEEEKQNLLEYAEQRARLEEKHSQLTENYQKMKKMYEKLQGECSGYEGRNAGLERDVKEIETLRAECGRLSSDNKDLQLQLTEARNRLETLQLKTVELSSTKKRVDGEVRSFTDQIDTLTQQKDQAQGRYESTKEALHTTESELHRVLQQISVLEVKLKESETHRTQLKSDLEKAELALRKSQVELKELQGEYEFAMLEQRRGKSTAELQIETLKQQVDAQRLENSSLFDQLQDARNQIRELKSETSMAQNSLKVLEKTRTTEEQLRKDLIEARRTLADYRQEILNLSHDRTALQYKLLDSNATR